MAGGITTNVQMISDATATYDLTGHYLSNEKDAHGMYENSIFYSTH